jgi:hypothetical protein
MIGIVTRDTNAEVREELEEVSANDLNVTGVPSR